ncbi:MAG: helicase, partial [Chloroflexaceae bacterium]|nr:helicase [Chloroflexaceae bacterium]
TSRVSTNEVANAKRRLSLTFDNRDRVDVALATNMISVGLDIDRLGLMVVLGQPKTAAEYIQSTSRVGRDESRPGLVVTLLNLHRPRDRSHYEHFTAWHDAFYRAVEATSVTPFSPRARDRGLAGVTVALARLGCPELTPALAAADIIQHRDRLEFVAQALCDRAMSHRQKNSPDDESLPELVKGETNHLLDKWQNEAEERGKLQYQNEEGGANPLLRDPLDPEEKGHKLFKAQRSLRDVEPTVNLWLKKPDDFD